MSENLRNQAEVFAVSLEIGAISVADVVAWAHAAIEAEEQPHWLVCDVIRQLAQGLARDRTRAERIASALYQLAQAHELHDSKLQSLAWWASDALDLADKGVQETRDEVIDQMLVALTEAAEAEAPIQRPF